MTDHSCTYCDSDRLVPVLDKNIEEQDKPGNKYRRLCLACDRFGRMASADEWRDHDDARVIPAGKPREADEAVKATLFQGHPDETFNAAADAVLEDEPEPENEFDCPACGAHQTGFPDACTACETPFQWE